jgi:hypothetical protein
VAGRGEILEVIGSDFLGDFMLGGIGVDGMKLAAGIGRDKLIMMDLGGLLLDGLFGGDFLFDLRMSLSGCLGGMSLNTGVDLRLQGRVATRGRFGDVLVMDAKDGMLGLRLIVRQRPAAPGGAGGSTPASAAATQRDSLAASWTMFGLAPSVFAKGLDGLAELLVVDVARVGLSAGGLNAVGQALPATLTTGVPWLEPTMARTTTEFLPGPATTGFAALGTLGSRHDGGDLESGHGECSRQ